jgi:hypothetical protein
VEKVEPLLITTVLWWSANFILEFLHAQAMKSTSIYRRWKMVILSSLRKTFGH